MIDRQTKRALHAFSYEGVVLCNRRDQEAFQAEIDDIFATNDLSQVTCQDCLSLMSEDMRLKPIGEN